MKYAQNENLKTMILNIDDQEAYLTSVSYVEMCPGLALMEEINFRTELNSNYFIFFVVNKKAVNYTKGQRGCHSHALSTCEIFLIEFIFYYLLSLSCYL